MKTQENFIDTVCWESLKSVCLFVFYDGWLASVYSLHFNMGPVYRQFCGCVRCPLPSSFQNIILDVESDFQYLQNGSQI